MADSLQGPSGTVKLNKKPSVAAPKTEKPAAKKPAAAKVRCLVLQVDSQLTYA